MSNPQPVSLFHSTVDGLSCQNFRCEWCFSVLYQVTSLSHQELMGENHPPGHCCRHQLGPCRPCETAPWRPHRTGTAPPRRATRARPPLRSRRRAEHLDGCSLKGGAPAILFVRFQTTLTSPINLRYYISQKPYYIYIYIVGSNMSKPGPGNAECAIQPGQKLIETALPRCLWVDIPTP